MEKTIRGIGIKAPETGGDLDRLDRALEHLESLGCAYAELPLYSEEFIASGRILWRRVEAYRARCAAHGLRYTAHGPQCGNFMDEAHRVMHLATANAMIEISAAIGADVLVLHSGRIPPTDPKTLERLLGQERKAMRTLGEAAAPLGVTLALENLYAEGDVTAVNVIRLSKQIADIAHDNVVGALDFQHARIQTTIEGLDYAQSLATYAPYVRHLHVHDSFGRPKTARTHHPAEDVALGQGDLHLPLGWGDTPWETVAPMLRLRPGTTLILEVAERYWASEGREMVARARELAGMLEAATFAQRRPGAA
jgi:sugar phosphate isomerase/epimerase